MKRVLFVLLTGGLTLLFLLSTWQDATREWSRYQRRFLHTLTKEERRGVSGGIRQLIVKDLNRVDRCTTCHMAIDKPQLALAEQPFTAHPGKFLEWHPPERFGCTVCHGGQGLATEVDAAHGNVAHWEQPLLRGTFVQASCSQCHGNLEPVASHVPLLIEGKRVFRERGCVGCHAVKDIGQTVSVDLGEVGSKSYLLMEADFERMEPPHDRIHWLMTKLQHPRMLNPGVTQAHVPPGEEEIFPTAMPHFGFSDHEIEALTVYLLSLTSSNPPASYVTKPIPEPPLVLASTIERGKAVFQRVGCTACHGIEGIGGRHNWNAGLGEEVPSLMYVKAYYDRGSIKQLIRNGRQPVPRANASRPAPALYMPAWKDKVTEEELDALVNYLFSLYDRLPQSAPAGSPTARDDSHEVPHHVTD